jgi:hypothetical protein
VKTDDLTAVLLKIEILWDMMLCDWMDDPDISEDQMAFVFKGRWILQNVGSHRPKDTASHPRRPES